MSSVGLRCEVQLIPRKLVFLRRPCAVQLAAVPSLCTIQQRFLLATCAILHTWLADAPSSYSILFHCFMPPQGWLHASPSTLLDVHNISMPDRISGPSRPELSLERFVNMRALTLTRVHRGRESCLPGVPYNLRTLTLDAGRSGKNRCVVDKLPSWA